jgi:endonuclease YncB( thermonuclease family)
MSDCRTNPLLPFGAALVLLLGAPCAQARELVGHAIVQGDASLLIKENVVRLDGIYIPPTGRDCRDWINPVRCDSRAALALDFKVSGFIHCFPTGDNSDGSINATCYQNRTTFDPGLDLAAYLIQQGLAVALPDAPFEYQALEKIARTQGVGIWGFRIDSFGRDVFPPGKGWQSVPGR